MSLVAFERGEIERLLGLLDDRLKVQGVRGSVYVVGGAAIAMTIRDERRTVDVDAVVSDPVVLEEARKLAEDERIPRNWLNENAKPWIPPRPAEAMAAPNKAGLTIHWAPPAHLLAMKLVAMRPQDAPDIVALATRLGLGANADEYADLLEHVYDAEDALQQVLNVPYDSVRAEAVRRGEIAAGLLLREGS